MGLLAEPTEERPRTRARILESDIERRFAGIPAEGYRIDTVYMPTFNKAEAAEWLELFRYPHQRPLKARHVSVLAQRMRDGAFFRGTMIIVATIGGEIYLLDGQHRLSAVVEADIEQQFVVLEITCTTMEIAGLIYGNIDTGKGRTMGDSFIAHQLPARLGLGQRQLTAFSGAYSILRGGGIPNAANQVVTAEERERVLILYAPAIRELWEVAFGMPKAMQNSLKRAYVQAFAGLTFRWPAQLEERTTRAFWEGVIFNDGLIKGDPRKLLHEHLLTTKVSPRGWDRNSTTILAETGFRAFTLGYNAYIRGQSLVMLKAGPRADGSVIKIMGVPADSALWLM